MSEIKQLSKEQLSQFDRDLMEPHAKDIFWKQLRSSFGTDNQIVLNVLDIGGGSGSFVDMLIKHMPNIHVTVLDNSEYLLNQNKKSKNKHIVLGSADKIEELFPTQKFDLITINWVLHHLVGKSRKDTIKTIKTVLLQAKGLLTEKGKIAIFENVMNGSFFDTYPNRLIYFLTSGNIPLLTPFIRKHYFNTAGVGVFFMSHNMLENYFSEVGLQIENLQISDEWFKSRSFRMGLMIRSIKVCNYWLYASEGGK